MASSEQVLYNPVSGERFVIHTSATGRRGSTADRSAGRSGGRAGGGADAVTMRALCAPRLPVLGRA